jgi:BA14K-like protein
VPIAASSSLQNAAAPSIETVQWRRGWRGRGGGGWGPGIVAGAIVGGAPGYYAPGPGYATGDSGGNDDAYCSERFRSYDPSSRTYMGYDGQRHPCP